MDGLIQQIAQTIEPKDDLVMRKALRELILSGLSRGGFLKACPYLSGFDKYDGEQVILSFLQQDSAETGDFQEFRHFLEVELEAAGVQHTVTENENGWTVASDDAKAVIFIIRKDHGLDTLVAYQQAPIAYELRTVGPMREGVRAEIERMIDRTDRKEKPAEKKKKAPAKSAGKKKKENEPQDGIQQLSLFDF